MAVPFGILVAIYTSEFASRRSSSAIRYVLDILNGVPTIVTGIFIFGLMVVGQASRAASRVRRAGDRDAAPGRALRPRGAIPGPGAVKEAGLRLGPAAGGRRSRSSCPRHSAG